MIKGRAFPSQNDEYRVYDISCLGCRVAACSSGEGRGGDVGRRVIGNGDIMHLPRGLLTYHMDGEEPVANFGGAEPDSTRIWQGRLRVEQAREGGGNAT